MAGVRIVYVGHSTVLVDMDGVRLLTDPLLRPRLAHLRRVGKLDAGALRGVDAVLVSHIHFDHLDLPSLERLGRELPLVVPSGAAGLLRRKRFRSVTELAVGEELRIGPLTIRGAPAVHDAGRVPLGVRAEPMGHVISGARSVYFAGDTDVFDGMAELAPVDVALVPVAGWGSRLGPGHMDPRGAADAVALLEASVAIPIHWGTYLTFPAARGATTEVLEAPAEEFSAHVRELDSSIDVRLLRPGEQTTV
jgi:L-ascorbate metabolism protein UlaG (beta-lactamase superfamily)